MLRRRPRADAVCRALALAWLWLVALVVGVAPSALANTAPGGAAGFDSWMADTAAHALQAAEPDNDLVVGGREAMNRAVRRGLLSLQQIGPARLRRFTIDLEFRENLQVAYDLGATQPLLRTREGGDKLWLRGRFRHDPDGQNLGDLGLHYRRRVFEHDVTWALKGVIEDHFLQDYRRFGFGTQVRSPAFEVTTWLFDDVPGPRLEANDVPDRRLDGYAMSFAARIPRRPWAWIKAQKQWQIAVDSDQVSESDRLSLQLNPLAPLEFETGTAGNGERRSWFATLRFKIRLGGGA